jgi:flagellin-like protein
MRLSKDSRGISEIVGAMMLILIVVIAAGSLAVFVSEQQESMQEKERLQQKIDNEEMQITSVIPHLNAADPTQWDYVNFTISNLNIENSEIVTIRINDHTLRTGDIWRYNHTLDKFEMETMSYQDHIEFESLEQASINITMDDFF